MNVYPNPSLGETLRIELKNQDASTNYFIQLSNAAGFTFVQKKLFLKENSTLIVDLLKDRSISKGVYFLKVVNGKEQFFKRVIIN